MKDQRKKAIKASSTASGNLEDLLLEESMTGLINHQTAGELSVADNAVGGFTHSPIVASKKQSVKAELDDLDDDMLEDMPEDGISAVADDDEEDDADEFDEVMAEFDDEIDATDDDDDDDDGISPTEILSADELPGTDVLPSEVEPQQKIETEEALEKTEIEENDKTDRQRPEKELAPVKAKKATKASDDEQVQLVNNQKDNEMLVEVDSSVEDSEFPLIDIDGLEDDIDTEELVFASIGDKKVIIHSNRIIASMDEEQAKVCAVDDVYLDDDFDEAVIDEVESKGLRAGLRRMNFALATVKIKASKQMKASVAKATQAFKIQMKADLDKKQQTMQQCFALAAVGLNRNLFTDYTNELRSDLISKLQCAGVRDASRLVKASFADYGVDYAQKLMTIASEISELPEENRDGLAAQLDMTSEPDDDEVLADPNIYGDPVCGAEDDLEDDVVDSVESALRNPIKAKVQQVKASYDKPLPFTIY